MWEDPILKEVRQTRLEIERECESDFRKIYERALEIQKRVAKKMVSGNEDQREKASFVSAREPTRAEREFYEQG